MSSIYGKSLSLSIFGQSHSPAIGMTLDGIPAGLPVDEEKLINFMNRRAPGKTPWSTPRKESDQITFLGGVLDGFTCGAPIAATIPNTNTRSADYANTQNCPRPGHADFTAEIKYGGFQDRSGGGHFSGRLTAPLCIAGGLCLQWLEEMGIQIGAHIYSIGNTTGLRFDDLNPQLDRVGKIFPTLDVETAEQFISIIDLAHKNGDSVGGKIECAVIGLPAGLGEPMFEGVESKIAQILFGIPAVKSVSFGQVKALGSQNNDSYTISEDNVVTNTNNCGGILGGITNGAPLIFDVGIKPTPSIAQTQETVDLTTMQKSTLDIKGRHDPCILPRAVPVIEAAAAIAIFDMILGNTQTKRRK